MRFIRPLALSAAGVVALSMTTAATAFGGDSSSNGKRVVAEANPDLPSTSGFSTAGGTDLDQAQLVIGGTSGCYGQTDLPHRSSHYVGTANVEARTVCPTTDYVSVTLYRSRWYGWQSWGYGSKTAYGWAETNAAGPCKTGDTYTYLGNSYHSGTGAGYAYTSNSARFTCL